MHAGTIGRVSPAHGSHRRCRHPSHLLHCTCSGRCLSRVCLRSEDDVSRRDVSPYGCEDVISCLSIRQSRERRSLTPYSARVWCMKNPYSTTCATRRCDQTKVHALDLSVSRLRHAHCLSRTTPYSTIVWPLYSSTQLQRSTTQT